MLKAITKVKIKKGSRVIVWADFDLPLENGKIANEFRMRSVLPTIRFLLKKGARIRIVSKLGHDRAISMAGISRRLAGLLNQAVVFIKNPLDSVDFKKFNDSSDILFFENT
jgi:phosphoglycerate kinase